jgi:hypothetical protein
LNVKTKLPDSIQFYAFGSSCKDTLDGAIIYRDEKKDTWKTLMRSDSFKNSRGEKIGENKVKELIFASGDGTVSTRSFFGSTLSDLVGQDLLFLDANPLNKKLVCESHVAIPNNSTIQEEFLSVLNKSVKN